MNAARIKEAIDEAKNHESLGKRLNSDQVELAPLEIAEMALCSLQRIHELLSGRHYYDYNNQEWIDENQAMLDIAQVVDEGLKSSETLLECFLERGSVYGKARSKVPTS